MATAKHDQPEQLPAIDDIAVTLVKLATLLYANGLLEFKNAQPADFDLLMNAVESGGIRVVLEIQPTKTITCIASTADGRELPPFFRYDLKEKAPIRQQMN